MSLAQILGLQGPSKIPKRFAPFYQQAGSEALVRYAPEWDNLSQLRAASAQTMRQRVAQARTAGAILNNAAGMAIKDIQANPNASSPALQSLLPMLTQRQQDAPIVANQQALQATNEHLADLDKIHAQRASLLGQIGTFTIGRATDLVGSDRKLRHDANQAAANLKAGFIKAGVDPSTGAIVKGGPKDPRATQLPKTPSTIAKPPASYTGSEADWNNLSRSQRDSWVKQHPGSGGGKNAAGKDQYGNTRDQRVGRNSDFRKALTDARLLVQALKAKGHAPTFDTVYAGVSGEYGKTNIDIVKGAVQQALGGVDPVTGRRLGRLGVHGVHPRKPSGKPRPSNVSSGPAGTTGSRPT